MLKDESRSLRLPHCVGPQAALLRMSRDWVGDPRGWWDDTGLVGLCFHRADCDRSIYRWLMRRMVSMKTSPSMVRLWALTLSMVSCTVWW